MKVLFIGGTGRTGSTILDRVLGAANEWTSCGELAFFWRHGLVGNGLCSCALPLRRCPVWSKALEIVETQGPVDPNRMVELRRRFWSVHLPSTISRRLTDRGLNRLEEFPEVVARLYHAVAEVTGARVLIDSSKDAHYSMILRERTDLDIYFLHLVRDPRAIGFSWLGRKTEAGFGGDRLMERRGPIKSSVYYNVSNLGSEWLWHDHPERYRLLRYEDFADDPAATVTAISNWIGEPLDLSTALRDDGTFSSAGGHLAWGNPNRFESGMGRVAPDIRWVTGQPRWRSTVLFCGSSIPAWRYGYRPRQTALAPPRRRSGGSLWKSTRPYSSSRQDSL